MQHGHSSIESDQGDQTEARDDISQLSSDSAVGKFNVTPVRTQALAIAQPKNAVKVEGFTLQRVLASARIILLLQFPGRETRTVVSSGASASAASSELRLSMSRTSRRWRHTAGLSRVALQRLQTSRSESSSRAPCKSTVEEMGITEDYSGSSRHLQVWKVHRLKLIC